MNYQPTPPRKEKEVTNKGHYNMATLKRKTVQKENLNKNLESKQNG